MEQQEFDWAALHAQTQEVIQRLYLPLVEADWPIGNQAAFWEWRYYPPLAFCTPWLGGELTQEQMQWFRDQVAYARIQEVEREHRGNGSKIKRRELIVFDQAPRSLPFLLYHATPSKLVPRILSEGLKPGRMTGVSTTNFPEAREWVHLFESIHHATERWLLLSGNEKCIQSGPYTILRVLPQGVSNLLHDTCTNHGFVTANVVPPTHIAVEPIPAIEVPRMSS